MSIILPAKANPTAVPRNGAEQGVAINVAKNIDYYCYNLDDFKDEKDLRHENIPNLCKKYKIKKNLINPVYLS